MNNGFTNKFPQFCFFAYDRMPNVSSQRINSGFGTSVEGWLHLLRAVSDDRNCGEEAKESGWKRSHSWILLRWRIVVRALFSVCNKVILVFLELPMVGWEELSAEKNRRERAVVCAVVRAQPAVHRCAWIPGRPQQPPKKRRPPFFRWRPPVPDPWTYQTDGDLGQEVPGCRQGSATTTVRHMAHNFRDIFSPIINSDGLNTFV